MTVNDFNERIFVKGAAWHSVGIRNETGQSAAETADMFTNGIPVFEKQPIFIGEEKTPTDDFAIVRLETADDQRKRVMGYCTKSYNIVQPIDIIKLFDEKVKQPVESMGFLGKGEKQFLSWSLPKSKIIVGNKDEVDLFGALLAGFDAKVSISLMIATYRPVCENTFMSLLGYSKENKSENGSAGRVFVGHHNSKNIVHDLGAWMSHITKEAQLRANLLEGLFNNIAKFQVNSEKTLADILFKVYPETEMPTSYPAELINAKEEKVNKENESAEQDRYNVTELFNGGDKTLIDVSGWSLFNAVTGYENKRPSKKDATSSVLFGARSKRMNDALAVINDYAMAIVR